MTPQIFKQFKYAHGCKNRESGLTIRGADSGLIGLKIEYLIIFNTLV